MVSRVLTDPHSLPHFHAPFSPAFAGSDDSLEVALKRMDELLDEQQARENLRRTWAAFAKQLDAPVSVIIRTGDEPGDLRGKYLIDGEILDALPIVEGLPAPNRWTTPEELRERIFSRNPGFVARHFLERHRYPSPATLKFYAQFDYQGWIEFPIHIGGNFVAKLTFMHRHASARPRFLARMDAALQPLKTQWLLGDRVRSRRLQVQKDERRKFVGDIHDTVLNAFSGILWQAEELQARIKDRGSPELESLARIRRLAASSLGEGRRMISNLREGEIATTPLSKRLQKLAATNCIPGRIKCRFLMLGRPPAFDARTIDDLQRIGQETISNALLHGHASEVVLRINATSRHLAYSIKDNGRGFPVDWRALPGVGLASLKIRAARLGARLRYFSRPGKGATISLRIPITAPRKKSGAGAASKSGRQKIRVLVVDDHVLVREGLANFLRETPDIHVCGEASDAEEALEMLAAARPDICLVDLRLPGRDGLYLLREIAVRQPKIRLIVLTVVEADEMIAQCTRAGAKGYLLKTARAATIRDAIRRVHDGGTAFEGAVLEKIGARLGQRPVSDREREVLRLVAKGKSNKEIAAALDLQVRTVKTHLERVFAKLGVRSRTEAVQAAASLGLISQH